MEKNLILLEDERDRYNHLVEEARAIIVQRVKNSRTELIVGYGELGQLIYTHPLYKKYGKGNRPFIRRLFKDIRISRTTGYYAIQFYEKYIHNKFKDVSNALETILPEEGDNLSWHKICNKYLPASKVEEASRQVEAKPIKFHRLHKGSDGLDIYFEKGTLVWKINKKELKEITKKCG